MGYTTGNSMILYDIINLRPIKIEQKSKKISDTEFTGQPQNARRTVDPQRQRKAWHLHLTQTTYHKVGMLSIVMICKMRGIIHRVYWIEMRKGSGHRWRGMRNELP